MNIISFTNEIKIKALLTEKKYMSSNRQVKRYQRSDIYICSAFGANE